MRISSNPIIRAALVAAWLASTALAMPQVVDRDDPPPTPPAPPKPIATADQVDITQPNTTVPPPQEQKPPVPITVRLFPSSPGVKNCRGASFCYNLPGTAQCGIFMGNKADGCEAKLFRGERCSAFSNVAVFQDELRPVGGFFASMSIKCGVIPVEPKPLSLGGLGGKMQKPVQGKGKKARRAVVSAILDDD
ncbi:hypothetical protein HER10_EVM0001789 [Colletotrichum scovillei]|uniref:uncharacterized protein n=1 Tax=Colletotrichum scovillei TaxID=1209932 RepID=UPI0015C3B145|nr:uncharacterized protein HER10_EVM0001789 [Colletotrichum scovillei]KAF4775904.1 hypothetical protein HER10_EVM0001789 [Colletotrichum scovillei]